MENEKSNVLKIVPFTQSVPNPLYTDAQVIVQKEGYMNIQEYINDLLRRDVYNINRKSLRQAYNKKTS